MDARYVDRRGFLRLTGAGAAGIAAAGLLAACGSDGGGATTTSGAGAGAGATSATASGASGSSWNGNLRVSMPTDVKTLDPQKQGDMPSVSLANNIFDFLVTRDAQNKLAPGIATEWSTPDPKTWRFIIRKGVKFHNGEVCDANAVAYSINRLKDPATKSPIVELTYVTSAKAVDDYTVDFQMSAPDPIIPAKLTLFGGVIVPPQYIKEKGDAGFAANPVGTGPFKFVSRQQDQQIVLEANDDYWGTKTQVKKLTFLIQPNPATAIAALQSGGVDIVTGLTPDAAAQLGDSSGASVKVVPGVREYYVAMNTLVTGPLANKDVRIALNYAVDVPTIIKTIMGGAATRSATLLPETVFGFDPSVKPFEHDLAKAKSMLAAAGYPDGFSTKLSSSTVTKDVVQAIAGQLQQVGVKCDVNIVDAAAFKDLLLSGDPQAIGPMYLSGNTGWTLDSESYLQSTIKSDRRQSLWHNKDADNLVTIEETSLDSNARKDAFAKLQQMFVDEAPFIYLYYASNVYALNNNIDWTIPTTGSLSMASAKGK